MERGFVSTWDPEFQSDSQTPPREGAACPRSCWLPDPLKLQWVFLTRACLSTGLGRQAPNRGHTLKRGRAGLLEAKLVDPGLQAGSPTTCILPTCPLPDLGSG